MLNFLYDIPTKVYFGEGEIKHLGEALKEYGKRVLLVYGGGSIKRTGIYDRVTACLKEAGLFWAECGGVEPNPRIETVRRGIALCKKEQIDVVLAVGGGSSIDCAKVIAAGANSAYDAWELVKDKTKIESVLPVIAVLTLAATGSEMDAGAVISNPETMEKLGVANPGMAPKYAFMDPTYTYSVSPFQTAAGTADIMSHTIESYFQKETGNDLTDTFAEGILKTCVKYGPIAVAEPKNYTARANLMWAGSWAINNLLKYGKGNGWSCHPMEHELSAYYDMTHGLGLAILTPHWMRYILSEETLDRFVSFGVEVFGIDRTLPKMEIAHCGIDALAAFFRSLGLVSTLKEAGVGEEHLEAMAEHAAKLMKNPYVALSKEDILKIYRAAL